MTMTKSEMAKLLTVCAAYDNRHVDEAMVEAWHAAIGDVEFEEARDQVIAHYRESAKWIMPAHIAEPIFDFHDRLARERANEREREYQRNVIEHYKRKDEPKAIGPMTTMLKPSVLRKTGPVLAFSEAMADMDRMLAAKNPTPEIEAGE